MHTVFEGNNDASSMATLVCNNYLLPGNYLGLFLPESQKKIPSERWVKLGRGKEGGEGGNE